MSTRVNSSPFMPCLFPSSGKTPTDVRTSAGLMPRRSLDALINRPPGHQFSGQSSDHTSQVYRPVPLRQSHLSTEGPRIYWRPLGTFRLRWGMGGGAPGVGGLAMSHWEGQSWTVWTSVQGTNLVGHKCSGHFQFYPLPTDFLGVPQEETSTQGGPPADRCVAVG